MEHTESMKPGSTLPTGSNSPPKLCPMTKAKEMAAWIIRSFPSVQSIADKAYAQGLAQLLSEHEYGVALMTAQRVTREQKFLPSIAEVADIVNRVALGVADKRRRESEEFQRKAADENAQEAADAYVTAWLNQHTGEPWYTQRVVDVAQETGKIPTLVPGQPGQGIATRAILEGWIRPLKAWVRDEARRQLQAYPEDLIEVPVPPVDVVAMLKDAR